ncbi:copper homeostasis protein cutC homolog [Ornithodoros turicata]|uniref:copper homeostasis protein cutC homolog n=1 Tax=Ornithodoros turicata TaxID=34597 RepID=UPI003138E058
METQFEVEICVDSLESAINAKKGGATRIELCSSLLDGGITPSLGMFKVMRKKIDIPIFVLIRPRGGDFYYAESEIEIMEEDISILKAHGAHGIVLGALTSDGAVDREACQRLIEVANPLPVTFHRAFDMTKDAFRALEDVIALGCKRLLTSGQSKTVADGLELLGKLSKMAQGKIIIMPGGGINEDNLEAVLRITGTKAFHSSASISAKSQMTFINEKVSMGSGSSEYASKVCSARKVENLVQIAKGYFHSG